MPGSLNFLLLSANLDGLRVDELLKLLLLRDEKVVLVSVGLRGEGVENGSNGLVVDDGSGKGGRGSDQLGLLVECGLVRDGVEDGGNGLAVDDRDREGGGCPGQRDRAVGVEGRGTVGRTHASREKLGHGGGGGGKGQSS